jgi:hypothetical protein
MVSAERNPMTLEYLLTPPILESEPEIGSPVKTVPSEPEPVQASPNTPTHPHQLAHQHASQVVHLHAVAELDATNIPRIEM